MARKPEIGSKVARKFIIGTKECLIDENHGAFLPPSRNKIFYFFTRRCCILWVTYVTHFMQQIWHQTTSKSLFSNLFVYVLRNYVRPKLRFLIYKLENEFWTSYSEFWLEFLLHFQVLISNHGFPIFDFENWNFQFLISNFEFKILDFLFFISIF